MKKVYNYPYDGISYFPQAREGHQFGFVRGNRIHTASSLEAAVTLRSELSAAKQHDEAPTDDRD